MVDGVSITVEPRRFSRDRRPSGSGKSTLLRMINRLVEADSGRVLIDGRTPRGTGRPAAPRIGYAIQGHGLFPHRTVAENIATVPRLLDWPSPHRARRRIARGTCGSTPRHSRGQFPHQLSGGQQQRVGVARALAAEPQRAAHG